jgi:hypothetical protein
VMPCAVDAGVYDLVDALGGNSSSSSHAGVCYNHSRMLGPWLRLLWQQHVGLREQLVDIARRRFAHQEWQQLLGVVAAAVLRPLVGGEGGSRGGERRAWEVGL